MSNGHLEQGTSTGMKVLLLASSILVIAVLGLTLRSLVFSDCRVLQIEYRKLLLSKAKTPKAVEAAKAFKISLEQVVVPELGVTDRCVSCHTGIGDPRMANERQPFRTHPGNILAQHPVSKYGCTTCHHGQGRATNQHDAIALNSFWDYPVLPNKMTQASCGRCHDPSGLRGKGGDVLALGSELFESSGCRSCHKLGGRGGVLGLQLDDEGRRIIPQLPIAGLVGDRTVWNWLYQHFRDPQGLVPTSLMRNPTLTDSEIFALTTFMLSLSKENIPEQYVAPDKVTQKYRALTPGPPNPARLYQQFCFSCHESGTFTRWDNKFKRFIPAIRGAGLAASPAGFLTQNITFGREGTVMPPWGSQGGGLLAREIGALDTYLRNGRMPAPKQAPLPNRGSANLGAGLFAQNCQGCHGAKGKAGIAPSLASATFQKAATDDFIVATIRNGRPDTAMPAFQKTTKAGLSNADLVNLLAYIRSLR